MSSSFRARNSLLFVYSLFIMYLFDDDASRSYGVGKCFVINEVKKTCNGAFVDYFDVLSHTLLRNTEKNHDDLSWYIRRLNWHMKRAGYEGSQVTVIFLREPENF